MSSYVLHLPSVIHEAVSEGDVVDDTAADGSDGQSYTTSIDPLKQHVFRVVLNLVYKKLLL